MESCLLFSLSFPLSLILVARPLSILSSSRNRLSLLLAAAALARSSIFLPVSLRLTDFIVRSVFYFFLSCLLSNTREGTRDIFVLPFFLIEIERVLHSSRNRLLNAYVIFGRRREPRAAVNIDRHGMFHSPNSGPVYQSSCETRDEIL